MSFLRGYFLDDESDDDVFLLMSYLRQIEHFREVKQLLELERRRGREFRELKDKISKLQIGLRPGGS